MLIFKKITRIKQVITPAVPPPHTLPPDSWGFPFPFIPLRLLQDKHKMFSMSIRGKREFETKRTKQDADAAYVKEVDRVDETRFTKDLSALIKESENIRLKYMHSHRMREFISMNVSILCALLGALSFGWYFMMKAELIRPFLYFGISFIPSILLYIWASFPLKSYKKAHKTIFMPKLAKALNGLSFFPHRGVSTKVIERLAVLPAHNLYKAEDCFMGRYKGVKVIFSEARLYSKAHKKGAVFDGIFVLLEAPNDTFEGHTIITANQKMVEAYSNTRWKSMNPVSVPVSDTNWDKFTIYSTKPDAASRIIDERLLKELAEASNIFDSAPLTAVLFKKRFMFMMIPYEKDMFEASDLFVPVTTRDQALRVKGEIEQLLEIVDVFDLYQN